MVLLVLVGACGDEALPPTAPAPPVHNAIVTGRVSDWLLGTYLPGIRVTVGPVTVPSDSTGRFRASVPQGRQVLLIDSYGYERYQDTLNVITFHDLNVSLRRQAPALLVCLVDASGVHAWVRDLQGRKSVDRRFATQVDIGGTGGTRHLIGNDLDWHPLDDFTWRVEIPGVHAARGDIHWRLVDGDGFTGVMTCDEASGQAPTDSGELM